MNLDAWQKLGAGRGRGRGSLHQTDKSDSDSSGSSVKSCSLDIELPPEFVLPCRVKLVVSWAENIEPGHVAMCVASSINSPSEFFLTLVEDYYGEMEEFIGHMTDSYSKWSKMAQRFGWIASPLNLKDDSYACIRVAKDTSFEWLRAKVLFRSSSPPEQKYKCFAVDVAKHYDVALGDLAYMHEQFIGKPVWAAKCRVALSSFYDKFHEGTVRWPDSVKVKFQDALKDNQHKFEAEFVRPIKQKNETIWEVSLRNVKEKQLGNKNNLPIQQQVIKMCYGQYIDD